MSSFSTTRLRLGHNFTISPKPQIVPLDGAPHVLIIGGGVTGLTTAWVLLDRGYQVTVLSKQWASEEPGARLTSQIAGALWEYPPAVCGQHTDAISLSRSKKWCIVAYEIWNTIANMPELKATSGVRMKRSAFFFPDRLENDHQQLHKFQEILGSRIRGTNRDVGLVQEHNVNPQYGVADAYEHLAPIIDTDVAMVWLKELVCQKGAKFVTETIVGDIFEREDELCQRFSAQAIVNATGLAGTETANDSSCYPIRGALIRVINDGRDFPKVTSALTITADAIHDSNEIVFIVPRNDNILLLGGMAQYHEDKLDLTLDSPVVARMRARCEAFLPGLKNARLDEKYPLAQGLRPFRKRNVRVERELRKRPNRGPDGEARAWVPSRVVHSYGQGGAGWSLSFGCAEDVACLVEDVLHGLPAEPMETFMKRFDVVRPGITGTGKETAMRCNL